MESSFGQAELGLHSRPSLVFSRCLPKAHFPSLQACLAPPALLLELITGKRDVSPCSLFVAETVVFEVPHGQWTSQRVWGFFYTREPATLLALRYLSLAGSVCRASGEIPRSLSVAVSRTQPWFLPLCAVRPPANMLTVELWVPDAWFWLALWSTTQSALIAQRKTAQLLGFPAHHKAYLSAHALFKGPVIWKVHIWRGRLSFLPHSQRRTTRAPYIW